tara:strand:+ start:816 stop:1157 length:342 start_codon:yes stop_codon:yes gene_type:complete
VKTKKHNGISDNLVLMMFLVFVILIVFFFSDTESQTKQDQKIIMNSIIAGDSINNEKILEFTNSEYHELKKRLGVNSEFVIHFEDENGNLIEIADKPCIGSSYALVGGHKCGE